MYPSQYIRYIDRINKIRQELLEEKYQNTFRNLEVYYISDETGVGKTRFIMETYRYENVFRISNYKNPFDHYMGQNVIVFEEFRSSLPIESMLNYLDGYPTRLEARYNDRVACYTIVFVVSNWDFIDQYEKIQNEHSEKFKVFDRRFKLKGNLNLIREFILQKEIFEVTDDENM